MAGSDMRYYETFYGIHTDDWVESFGSFSEHPKLLTKEYLSEGCICTNHSTASTTHKFLYPQHIAKEYFIEGVITGHITLAASTATAYVCKYRVTLCKVHEDTTEKELFTTGWVTIDKTIDWDSTYGIGEEVVLPFYIDAWEKEKLDEKERIFLQIESTCSDTSTCSTCGVSSCTDVVLWHSNDSTWEDVKITVPLLM